MNHRYYARLAAISLFCCLLMCFFYIDASARKTHTSYRKNALSSFSKGQEAFSSARFHEAYEYYDQTITAARRAILFEGLTADENRYMKNIIRQANNQKRQIIKILKHFQILIEEKKISRGMTPDQVKQSWGEPRDIKKNLYYSKETQEWYYGNILTDNDKYVFFTNGIVVDWNDKTKR